ncbi:glycosyltransferase family 2 protein [Microbacterium sp.]|uniref:glycosyltransferase family 2 protein n=1 Tax=Microbacterium sp. TaxID=51671 RepID=UPI0039E5B7F5
MIAMTMMVRDEADIVGAMIQYHLDQGVDLFLVTDNGSVDGTTRILEDFARDGRIELAHDPRHEKQQHEVVTRMSREAARRGAQWVLNADADEFWSAVDPSRTIAEELADLDPAIGAFEVPVIDMTGAPARRGTGLQRLVYRDLRPDDVMAGLGVHAHSTPDVAFVPNQTVEVAQGNHFVSVPANGRVPDGRGLVVHHYPWRSWSQFCRKVENAGRAYEASPHLRPSANHHGMRDYRRLQDGVLSASYVARHPSPEQLAEGLANGWFVEDRRIADRISSPVADEEIPESEAQADRQLMRRLAPLEQRLQSVEAARRQAADDLDFRLRHVAELDALIARLRADNAESETARRACADELEELRAQHRIELERTLDHRLRSGVDRVRRRLFR